MRIVFFGTPELAVPSLETLSQHHDVTALVCQPDKPVGRSKKPKAPPAKAAAERLGVPVHQPSKLNDGVFEEWLREQRPELCVLVAYGRILKQPILNVPEHGFLNVHPSLLPKYRGPSPIQTAVLNGDAETGVTIMRLDAGMDTGDILLQERAEIGSDEDAAALTTRLAGKGAEMLLQAVSLVERGEARFTPQNDADATLTHMIAKHDGAIRWSDSAEAIRNRVRGSQPWPVAHFKWDGETVRIHRAAIVSRETDAVPGTVFEGDPGELLVVTGAGVLRIEVIQAPGKKAMAATDFLRGHSIAPGTRFEDG